MESVESKNKIKRWKRPEGMHRELYSLIRTDDKLNIYVIFSEAPQILEAEYDDESNYKTTKIDINKRKKVRRWVWAPFTHNGRTDNLRLYHWQREEEMENIKPYPFAKFSKSPNIPKYTKDEYDQFLISDTWSYESTNYLLEMAAKFNLNFTVIVDRWDLELAGKCGSTPQNITIEDVKQRYYDVFNALQKARHPTEYQSKIIHFDAIYEKRRKQQLINLWNRTPEQIEEEQALLQELKKIETRRRDREKRLTEVAKILEISDANLGLQSFQDFVMLHIHPELFTPTKDRESTDASDSGLNKRLESLTMPYIDNVISQLWKGTNANKISQEQFEAFLMGHKMEIPQKTISTDQAMLSNALDEIIKSEMIPASGVPPTSTLVKLEEWSNSSSYNYNAMEVSSSEEGGSLAGSSTHPTTGNTQTGYKRIRTLGSNTGGTGIPQSTNKTLLPSHVHSAASTNISSANPNVTGSGYSSTTNVLLSATSGNLGPVGNSTHRFRPSSSRSVAQQLYQQAMFDQANFTGIKFPDYKAPGVFLRSNKMKLPISLGQKKTKAIEQALAELLSSVNKDDLKVLPNSSTLKQQKNESLTPTTETDMDNMKKSNNLQKDNKENKGTVVENRFAYSYYNHPYHPPATEEIVIAFNHLRNDIVLLYELKSAFTATQHEIEYLKVYVKELGINPPEISAKFENSMNNEVQNKLIEEKEQKTEAPNISQNKRVKSEYSEETIP